MLWKEFLQIRAREGAIPFKLTKQQIIEQSKQNS